MKVFSPGGTAVQRWLADGESGDPGRLAPSEAVEVEDIDAELSRVGAGALRVRSLPRRSRSSFAPGGRVRRVDALRKHPIADRPCVTRARHGGAGTPGAAGRLLERATSPSATEPLAKVIGRPGERKPLIVDDGCLYLERMRLLEQRFAIG